MSSLTDANQTATGDSAGDQIRKILSPFLTLVGRSDQVTGVVAQVGLAGVSEVTIGRGTANIRHEADKSLHWEVDDRQASRAHVRLKPEARGWRLDDLKSKNRTFVNGESVGGVNLREGDWIRVGSAFFRFHYQRVAPKSAPGVHLVELGRDDPFATLSPPLRDEFAQATELARTKLSILITGETGTGKELVATEIHRRSERSGKLIAVNCGAIPESLLESELFGHKKGAFSGANEDRLGLIRAAHNGTLFLDEIGELSEGSQVALLRVLQEKVVRPVGSTTTVPVNVRVIAATHQDLPTAVGDGRFREDLYARLAGHRMALPPLRDRREDLGIILSRLCKRLRPEEDTPVRFSNAAFQSLLQHQYPQNIRELEQALERAMALAHDGKISARQLPDEFLQAPKSATSLSAEEEQLEQRLRRVLEETRGNISATGRAFGKAPIQIRRWCERFKIDYTRYR